MSYLAIVVRKLVLHAAAVDVERLAQVFHRHDRALHVPARETPAPGAGPAHDVLWLGPLPEGEVRRVPLVGVDLHSRSLHQLLHPPAGELAVLRPLGHIEVDRAVYLISIALIDKGFDQLDLFRNVPACSRRDVGTQHVESVHILKIPPGIFLHQLHRLDSLSSYPLHNAILTRVEEMSHIGYVLDIAHLIAEIAQVAHDSVEVDVCLAMAEVSIFVNRWPADVHSNPPLLPGYELLLLTS